MTRSIRLTDAIPKSTERCSNCAMWSKFGYRKRDHTSVCLFAQGQRTKGTQVCRRFRQKLKLNPTDGRE